MLIIFALSVHSQTYGDVSSLYTDVLTGYNKYIRPVLNQSDLLQVNITYDIGGIQEIDEVEGTMTAFIQLQYGWIDERIAWNPALFNNTYSIALPLESVWKPELVLVNAAGTVLAVESSMTTVRYIFNGLALWFPTGVVTVSCAVNIEFYPYDTQTCPIMFIVNNYLSTEMTLLPVNIQAPLNYFSENGVWDLTKTEAVVSNNGLNMLSVNLKLARKPLFVVMIVIAPTMLLSFLNIMVFLLPPDSGERMSFSITLLLALAVFLTIISDNIPKTSSPLSILCYFIGMQVLLSAIISVATIFNLRIYHKTEEEGVPSWVCSCLRKAEGGEQGHNEDYKGQRNSKSDVNSGPVSMNGGVTPGTVKTGSVVPVKSLPPVRSNGAMTYSRSSGGISNGESLKDWKFYPPSTGHPARPKSATDDKPRVTWKDISRYVDWVMFIASIIYFIVVLVVFIFVTAFRQT